MSVAASRESVGDLQTFKAAFFKALAHPVRIRILEELAHGERSVQEIQSVLRLEQPVASQQLSVLRANGVVVGRKTGASVRYSLRDQLVADLLVVARQIFNNQLAGSQNLLRQLQKEHRQSRR